MADLHPRFFISKRYPVHTAIELRDIKTVKSLLSDPMDAQFYLERKLPQTEISLLHQACCATVSPRTDNVTEYIVNILIKVGSDVNDVDVAGQTALFYAVTNSQADTLVPMLLGAGKGLIMFVKLFIILD